MVSPLRLARPRRPSHQYSTQITHCTLHSKHKESVRRSGETSRHCRAVVRIARSNTPLTPHVPRAVQRDEWHPTPPLPRATDTPHEEQMLSAASEQTVWRAIWHCPQCIELFTERRMSYLRRPLMKSEAISDCPGEWWEAALLTLADSLSVGELHMGMQN